MIFHVYQPLLQRSIQFFHSPSSWIMIFCLQLMILVVFEYKNKNENFHFEKKFKISRTFLFSIFIFNIVSFIQYSHYLFSIWIKVWENETEKIHTKVKSRLCHQMNKKKWNLNLKCNDRKHTLQWLTLRLQILIDFFEFFTLFLSLPLFSRFRKEIRKMFKNFQEIFFPHFVIICHYSHSSSSSSSDRLMINQMLNENSI